MQFWRIADGACGIKDADEHTVFYLEKEYSDPTGADEHTIFYLEKEYSDPAGAFAYACLILTHIYAILDN